MNLIAGILLLLVSSGRWAIPIAAWIAPIFLLRYARQGRPLPRLAAIALAHYGVGCLAWWGMVPVPAPGYFVIMLAIMLPLVMPYALDRLLVRPSSGVGASIVFAAAWVTMEFVNSRVSPYGSWGAVAYTQVDDLPLLQSAALTGLWGIAFLIAWSAAIANWAWERQFNWQEVRPGVLAWTIVLAAVMLLGGARMALRRPATQSIRVAGIALRPPPGDTPGALLSHQLSGATLDAMRSVLHAHEDTLFAMVRREAAAGARLVCSAEAGEWVLKDEQEAFERRAGAVAREAGIHLVVGAAVVTPGKGWYENLWLGFDSTGTRIVRYHKARPVPGDPERGADTRIPVVSTSLGNLAGAVCFDGDFPDLIRRSGRMQADLLVIPSSDWRAIDPIHTRMALVRGVENGCSVVRVTAKGLSAAADYQGRILASSDYFTASPSVMVAQVPMSGVRTPYSRLPWLLPVLSMGVLVGAAAARLARRG